MTEFLESMKFLSVSKFVSFINENKLAENIKNVRCYYKGTYTFKSKFDDICIKPVYVIIFTNSKPVYINHEKILSLFAAQPVIAFKTNKFRKIPEGRNRLNMFYLTIDFRQVESKTKDGQSFKYYPIEIHKETNEKVVEKIDSLRITTWDQATNEIGDVVLEYLN